MLVIGALFDSRQELFAELGVSNGMEAVQKIDMCIIELPSGPKVLFGQYCMQYGDCFSFMEWDGMYTSLVKKLPITMRHRIHVAYL